MKFHKPQWRNKQAGFSLVEFMIYLFMVSIVLTTIVLIAAEFMITQTKVAVMKDVSRDTRFASERIEIALREARSINFGSSTFNAHPGVLSLETTNPATDPTVFTVSVGGALTIQEGAGAVIPLTSTKTRITNFVIEDASEILKTRALRVSLGAESPDSQGYTDIDTTLTVQSTVPVHRYDGFSLIPPSNATLEQSAYRFFVNQDSADVGSPLVAQDTPATLATDGDAFRLRTDLHVGVENLGAVGKILKLQYAVQSGSCDTSFSGEVYADVTSSSAIAWNDNASVSDATSMISNVNDPTHGADTLIAQTYEEANNFTNPAAIAIGEDGVWDFSLIDNDGTASEVYCFRVVLSSGTALDTYTVIPEVTTATGVPPSSSTFEQSAYRLFANVDSADVGSPLAIQDTAGILSTTGDAFRLRQSIHVGDADLTVGGENFKLQYAAQSGSCDTGFSGEVYADVTTSTPIAYYDNGSVSDGANLTVNAADPVHSGHTTVTQTYEELNNFTSTSLVSFGNDGLWDFALYDNGASADTAYCLRVVKSDNSPLDTYSVVPEITTASAVGAQPVFRSTEYLINVGAFTGTTYNLALNQVLESNYFVMVHGSDGNGSGNGNRGPDENYMSLTADPFGTGDLAVSASASTLGFTRGNNADDWVGVVTVVECLLNCTTSGFTLVDVQRVSHGSTIASGADTSASWSSLSQVMLVGGYEGAGCDTTSSHQNNHTTCWVNIWPSGTGTINWTRDGSGGNINAATSTVMAVEWGSEWTVQQVSVAGTNGGAGADQIGEYNTSSISSVTRDTTWVWGLGTSDDNGIGSGSEGALITLGDGVSQNASETTVAVGMEYAQSLNFSVYALSHPNLLVDYRYKVDGDSGLLNVDIAIDSASAGSRMSVITNGQNGTSTTFPRPMFSSRYLNDTTVRLGRRRSGQDFPAWVQGINFAGIVAP